MQNDIHAKTFLILCNVFLFITCHGNSDFKQWKSGKVEDFEIWLRVWTLKYAFFMDLNNVWHFWLCPYQKDWSVQTMLIPQIYCSFISFPFALHNLLDNWLNQEAQFKIHSAIKRNSFIPLFLSTVGGGEELLIRFFELYWSCITFPELTAMLTY